MVLLRSYELCQLTIEMFVMNFVHMRRLSFVVDAQVADRFVGSLGETWHLYHDNLEQNHRPCHQDHSQVTTGLVQSVDLFRFTYCV